MKHTFVCLLISLLLVPTFAQNQSVKLRVKAILIDKELNQKPVPRLILHLRKADEPSDTEPLTLKTGFDGVGEIELPAGRYRLTTSQPVEMQGKSFTWEMDIDLTAGMKVIELSNDNARVTDAAAPQSVSGRRMDDLTEHFRRRQSSVVTVWTANAQGTGFIIDQEGLILTNHHVAGKSGYLAVQFDPQRKIPAVLLASSAEKDVAVLWANIKAFPEMTVAPLAEVKGQDPSVVEGERVFTIGSPLNQRKIMTTGIASKIEQRAIISDININHGNSGGPLFNSLGQVVGITTFGDFTNQGGPGVSGIVRIEEALAVIDEARAKMKAAQKPEAVLLPVEPSGEFPTETLKTAMAQEKFDYKPYFFGQGDYEVSIITPVLTFWARAQTERTALKEKDKRNKKNKEEAAQAGEIGSLFDLYNWREYLGAYKPVIMIRATPKLRETFGSAFGRALAAQYGVAQAATMKFKTDFFKMRLLCGDKEVMPIHPGKDMHIADVHNRAVNISDAATFGVYTYPFDAISGSCGAVTLELYSEKNPEKPTVKTLDTKVIVRITEDFASYKPATKAP